MSDKEKLIKWLSEQPNDIQIYKTDEDGYNCVNIKVFLKHRDKEFYEEYFGM